MATTNDVAAQIYHLEQMVQGLVSTQQTTAGTLNGKLKFVDDGGEPVGEIGLSDGVLDLDFLEPGPEPPQPTMPKAIAGVGSFNVQWDGRFVDPEGELGDDPLIDVDVSQNIAYVEVHAELIEGSSAPGPVADYDDDGEEDGEYDDGVPDPVEDEDDPDFDGSDESWNDAPDEGDEEESPGASADSDTFVGVMSASTHGGSFSVGPLSSRGSYLVWLVAVGRDKQESVPSDVSQVEVTVADVSAELMGTWLKADEAMVSADGKNKVYYGDEEPEGVFNDGDLWFGEGNMPHTWREDPDDPDASGWVSAADERVDAVQDAVDQLAEDLQNVIIDGGGQRTTWDPADPSEDYTGLPGDTWYKTRGNSIIGVWNWDGDQWVARKLDGQTIDNLDAGTITSGFIDAARIKAGSITADKILLSSGDGLIPDPRFANKDVSWTVAGGVKFIPADVDTYNWASFPLTPGVASLESSKWAVTPGDKYTIKVTFNSSPDASGLKFTIKGKALDNGVETVEPEVAWNRSADVATIQFTPGNLWVTATLKAEWTDEVNGPSTWNNIVSVTARKSVGTTVIEPGSITTEKIRVGAITAESGIIGSLDAGKITVGEMDGAHIRANTIATEQLAAGAVTANVLSADAINGKTITGATIRTNDLFPRIEMNPSGLLAFNGDGDTTFSIDQDTGNVTVDGVLTRTQKGATLIVGKSYDGSAPGIQWRGPEEYVYQPGMALTAGDPTKVDRLTIQGPGSAHSNSWMNFYPDSVAINAVQGLDDMDGPQLYMNSGAGNSGDYGRTWLSWSHPSNGGISRIQLNDLEWDLRTWDSSGRQRGYFGLYADKSSAWGVLDDNMPGNNGPYIYMKQGSGGFINMYWNHPSNPRWAGLTLRENKYELACVGSDNKYKSYIEHTTEELTIWHTSNIAIPKLPANTKAVPIGRVNGRLYSVSSSRKYKAFEEPLTDTVEDFENKLLSIEAKTWFDKPNADKMADNETAVFNGEEPPVDDKYIAPIERVPGVVAEDLDEAGLGVFVGYNDDGSPEWVMYDRIGPALIPVVRRLRDRVEALEAQLTTGS